MAIVENVEASARMITDELSSYGLVGHRMRGGHERVTHSKGEYVRPNPRTPWHLVSLGAQARIPRVAEYLLQSCQ